jgi:hypothetical protein
MFDFFIKLSLLKKTALISFVLGKALSIPTALILLSGDLDNARVLLYSYAVLIAISIVCSAIPEKRKMKQVLPDGVFHLDGMILTIKNGEVSDCEIKSV